jgi:hypothetical protein
MLSQINSGIILIIDIIDHRFQNKGEHHRIRRFHYCKKRKLKTLIGKGAFLDQL